MSECDTDNAPQGGGLIRAGDIWGAFVYVSMVNSRAAGDYESAREAQRVYNFKNNGTGGAKIKALFDGLAARLGCAEIIACPGHGTKETQLQKLFGVTIRRRSEVASRKYAHKKDIDFDAESATLELSYETEQRLKGRRVLVLDDVATTGKTLRFYKRYFEERGIYAELAAIGISKKLDPVKDSTWGAPIVPTVPKTDADYKAALIARRAEIGEIPPIADPARREACRLDLPRFLQTYMPSVFYRPFDADALALLADIQAAMLDGGRKAVARPRGSGKTAISLGAVLWAALYAHRRYLVFVAATAPAALQMIADAQAYLADEELSADFPEVCQALAALDGKPQRCKYQTQGGEPTKIEIKRECLVFPTVKTADGARNINAGVTIQAAGITGAIRGMHRTDSGRKWIRPDFVLLDDPQTRESATSPTQTDVRERIVNGDVMGLAGHDRKIAAIMACTVIARGDLSERFLDHDRHAEWRGQRTKLVETWGGYEALWNEYDKTYMLELSGAVEKGSAAAYYTAHRAELETGARVMCETLYGDGEISALQHARNYLVENGEFAFAAECQNEPMSLTPEADYELTARAVAAQLTHRGRGELPEECAVVAAGVDINRYAAAWAVVAASGGAVYEVIDYGFWLPAGRRELWGDEAGARTLEVAVSEAVNGVVRDLLQTKPYSPEISVVAVDAGYQAPTVYAACAALAREFRGKRIIPARGVPGDKYDEPGRASTIRRGAFADYRRMKSSAAVMIWDSHHWHMSLQRGFLVPVSAEGAVGLFGREAGQHAIYAAQVCADKLERSYLNPYGKTVAIFATNGRNEMGDVTAEAMAAISCEGISAGSAGNGTQRAPNASAPPTRSIIAPQTSGALERAEMARNQRAVGAALSRPVARRGGWVSRW